MVCGAKILCCYFLLILAMGCSTKEAKKINDHGLRQRNSYTDTISRIMAKASQQKLALRTQDYKLGANDVVEIGIYEWEKSGENKTVETRVTESGIIHLPMLGSIEVKDKSVGKLKSVIEKMLVDNAILIKPQVSILVKEFRSKQITLIGAVKEPGMYQLRRNVTTLLDALSQAGGLSQEAGQLLYVIQDKPEKKQEKSNSLPQNKIQVDLYELIELGQLELNVILENGDVVYVPQAQKFFVTGYVKNVGSYPLKKPTTVLEGVALAGGLQPDLASPDYCLLKRRDKNNIEKVYEIDLIAIIERQAPNLFLLPDDILIVRQTTGKYLYNEFSKFFRVAMGFSIQSLFD